MLCNDDCKELHPYARRLAVMSLLHERWEQTWGWSLKRLACSEGRPFLPDGKEAFVFAAHASRREGLMEGFGQGVSCQTEKG